jgi:hypothetical protein
MNDLETKDVHDNPLLLPIYSRSIRHALVSEVNGLHQAFLNTTCQATDTFSFKQNSLTEFTIVYAVNYGIGFLFFLCEGLFKWKSQGPPKKASQLEQWRQTQWRSGITSGGLKIERNVLWLQIGSSALYVMGMRGLGCGRILILPLKVFYFYYSRCIHWAMDGFLKRSAWSYWISTLIITWKPGANDLRLD